jgi:hypothetical protein
MKQLITLFAILFLFLTATNAQDKPALPGDYFERYSYTLPEGFDYQDPQQLDAAINKMASSLLTYLQAAETSYQVDSNDLYTIAYYKMSAALALNQFPLALQAIESCRALKPAPAYRVPFGLTQEAWTKACLRHADDQSEAFKLLLQQELQSVVNRLDNLFRSDIVNAQKGSFTPASIQVNFNEVRKQVEQSMSLSNRRLTFAGTYSTVEYYLRYTFRKKYQPAIEATFYQLFPARVEEMAVMIPMRDGVKLSALVYRDVAEQRKVPAVVSLSPYPSGNEALRGNVFATNGYIYVYVDSRGRRNSEGHFFPYEDDARDYYDIIDWVSKQSWCDGQVATSGGSYLGFTQWQAIRKPYKHPALKAINPMVAVGFGVDFPQYANAFYPYILQWAVYVSGKELNDARFGDYTFWNKVNYGLYKKRVPFAKLDSVAGLPNPFFRKWVSHPGLDAYWKSILPSREDYAALDLPVLTITGYYDDDQVGAFYYFNNHHKYASASAAAKHYMLIGPYDHGGSQWQPASVQAGIDIEKEAQVPIYKYVIWWYDWVLKGKPKPAFLKEKINYFVTGTGQWKTGPSFKQITRDTLDLYLSQQTISNAKRKELFQLDGRKPAQTGVLTYRHDIARVIDSAFLYAKPRPFDDSLYMSSPYNLVFESKPLEKDIILTDKITAQLYLSLNVPDADFMINIYEMDEAGKSYNLAGSLIRSRYRKGGDKPVLMKPGEIALHNFDNVFLYVKKIPKGHRIRFTFESVNSPLYEKNYGFGGVVSQETTDKPRIIEATIHTGPKYPSRILMPYTNE